MILSYHLKIVQEFDLAPFRLCGHSRESRGVCFQHISIVLGIDWYLNIRDLSDMLEVSLSAEQNTKTTSRVGVLELVSNTQGIVSDNFRKQGHTEQQWRV